MRPPKLDRGSEAACPHPPAYSPDGHVPAKSPCVFPPPVVVRSSGTASCRVSESVQRQADRHRAGTSRVGGRSTTSTCAAPLGTTDQMSPAPCSRPPKPTTAQTADNALVVGSATSASPSPGPQEAQPDSEGGSGEELHVGILPQMLRWKHVGLVARHPQSQCPVR